VEASTPTLRMRVDGGTSDVGYACVGLYLMRYKLGRVWVERDNFLRVNRIRLVGFGITSSHDKTGFYLKRGSDILASSKSGTR